MRKWIVGLCVVLVLGCAGIQDAFEELSSVEMDVKSGADAVHPADFPLTPPPNATLATSTDLTMRSLRTRSVIYEASGDADTAALLDQYEDEIRAAGFAATERTDNRVASKTVDEGNGLAVDVTKTEGKTMISMTELVAVVDAEE